MNCCGIIGKTIQAIILLKIIFILATSRHHGFILYTNTFTNWFNKRTKLINYTAEIVVV